jgi:UDP-galactopyranose mutase
VKVVVVGAGFAGACAALTLREQLGCDVTVLEQNAEPGGMLRTFQTEEGVPYEYGPRVASVFRGTADILPFLRRFLKLEERQIYQGTRLRPDYPVVPFPVDLESVRDLPCGAAIERELAERRGAAAAPADGDLREYLESSLGPTLTQIAFEGFNRKFWGRRLDEMPAEWGKLRRLERIAAIGEFRLPSDAPHYYPLGGFNPLFEQMLGDIDVRTGTPVREVRVNGGRAVVRSDYEEWSADLVIATAPIDALLDYRFGALEWRGYRIETEVVDGSDGSELGLAPDGIPFAWLYTPWAETPVCRTTDFGVIHHGPERARPAVILREIVDESVSMYPVWWETDRFHRYLEEVSRIERLIPLGRLGLYKYVTMDSTLSMIQRLCELLENYLGAEPAKRFELLRAIRGDWDE